MCNGCLPESSIKLKADKTEVNSAILDVKGLIRAVEAKIVSLEAVKAEIEDITAKKIESVKADVSWLTAKTLTLKTGVYAPFIRATDDMSLNGKTVATQDWVTTTLADYASKTWISSQGYLTGIPATCNASTGFYAPYIRAATAMSVGNKAVATQEWVKKQLESYAKSDHSHTWTDISDKPSTFAPASHKHKFSTETSFAWGHVHTTISTFKAGDITGGINNYKNKKITISGTTDDN